jgi:hypothetical protein
MRPRLSIAHEIGYLDGLADRARNDLGGLPRERFR